MVASGSRCRVGPLGGWVFSVKSGVDPPVILHSRHNSQIAIAITMKATKPTSIISHPDWPPQLAASFIRVILIHMAPRTVL